MVKDFGDVYPISKYFPQDGEPDLESFGADSYLLCGQFNSNLSLLTRTPLMNKRLLAGEKASVANIDRSLRKVMSGFAKAGPEADTFVGELSRMLMDYHDFQLSVRTIAKGEFCA